MPQDIPSVALSRRSSEVFASNMHGLMWPANTECRVYCHCEGQPSLTASFTHTVGVQMARRTKSHVSTRNVTECEFRA